MAVLALVSVSEKDVFADVPEAELFSFLIFFASDLRIFYFFTSDEAGDP